MPDPSSLRDSTQIVLPQEALAGLEAQLDEEFTITIFPEGDRYCRIIGSPVEIKEASQFLVRQGVSLP
ncbi:hypothetical protein ACFQMM_08205 [Saliphagus sp. GCM10025308]|uniref:Uncharacterized protein n=1 Tax=Natronosalvus rutilus TaxID=2953753 RepID=A0A9E7NCQ2_9EURY|nr:MULTISPECIES: hypothetical protein [Natronosalvus]USZ71670.1 hypothetical protein NGM15_16665 [Natronosalvus halobius]UTF55081.1 hypothetical protein NGM29_07475 [Natronosalvus rutilus]